jgi:hypothetical protein
MFALFAVNASTVTRLRGSRKARQGLTVAGHCQAAD